MRRRRRKRNFKVLSHHFKRFQAKEQPDNKPFRPISEEFQQTHVIQEQDELIKILKVENERLQELLETEVINHHKNVDAAKDRITRVGF